MCNIGMLYFGGHLCYLLLACEVCMFPIVDFFKILIVLNLPYSRLLSPYNLSEHVETRQISLLSSGLVPFMVGQSAVASAFRFPL